jgi:hypothetical protein
MALGTTRRLLSGRPYLAIRSGMLFQQEGRQLLAQKTGHVLAFREGHQLVLIRFTEHPFECSARTQQPAFPKCLSILPAQK